MNTFEIFVTTSISFQWFLHYNNTTNNNNDKHFQLKRNTLWPNVGEFILALIFPLSDVRLDHSEDLTTLMKFHSVEFLRIFLFSFRWVNDFDTFGCAYPKSRFFPKRYLHQNSWLNFFTQLQWTTNFFLFFDEKTTFETFFWNIPEI